MPLDPLPIIRAYPDHIRERIRRLNSLPVQEEREFGLYWMHHAVRGHENPALDAAIFAANLLRKPVLVYQGLGGRHPYNSDRHYTFIMEGCREVQRELTSRNISYCFHLDRDPATPTPLMKLSARSALTLTEDFPAPPINGWADRAAATLPTAFWAVDTACIMPMQLLKTSYTRAFLFRKHTWAEFEARIARRYEELENAIDRHHSVLDAECLDLQSAELAELCGRARIDHTVAPVPHTQGGSTAGYARWEQFKRHGLPHYADTRNDAAIAFPEGVSRMSAYLHHGHVSPFRIAREAAQCGGDGAEKFLDEMLIWRELAHNFCFHHSHPHTLASLPSWALRTLEDHRHDSRRPVYTREQLLRGTTGDPLWDAAQKSLVIHGELHNNLRMTWGKAILQWTPTPEAALQTMIELNHRFALDGSDPNSYGGILYDSALVWACRNSSKPGRGTADTWVLHAGSEWSSAHLELDPDEVAGQLTKTFFDAAGSPAVEPLLVSAHCWRHARTANPLEEECLWDSEEKIGVCGDWCCRSRIEGAYLSGAALAGRILGAAGTWQESSRKGASFC
jgi:hypothetical protein